MIVDVQLINIDVLYLNNQKVSDSNRSQTIHVFDHPGEKTQNTITKKQSGQQQTLELCCLVNFQNFGSSFCLGIERSCSKVIAQLGT